jgi:protein-S-isoprenylcysteine O-methyltransferase Ste14
MSWPELNRIALPIAILAAALIVKVWPILRLRRRARRWPIAPSRMSPRQRTIAGAIGLLNLAQCVWVALYAALGPARLGVWPSPPWLGLTGWAAILIGCSLMAWSQGTMGDAWRLGAASGTAATHRLIDRGPYRRVRHPIYAGWLLMLAGLLLTTPALWSAIGFAAFASILVVQARFEEASLRREFGAAYDAYSATVGMFWPRRILR